MTVVPLNRSRPRVEPAPGPAGYVTLPAGARNAHTALKGRMAQLDRIFAGPNTPAAMAAQIEQLTLEMRAELQRLAELSR